MQVEGWRKASAKQILVTRRPEKSAAQRREPMNKNRRGLRVTGEEANDGEAHIHQAEWWKVRRLSIEGG
jgi:hypothetical protein